MTVVLVEPVLESLKTPEMALIFPEFFLLACWLPDFGGRSEEGEVETSGYVKEAKEPNRHRLSTT